MKLDRGSAPQQGVLMAPAKRRRLWVGLSLSWLLATCGGGPPEEREEVIAPAVEAVSARRGSLPLEERLSGVVRARNQVAVRAEIEAPVVQALVRSGEAVDRGQPLVRLDDTTLREQLRQTEASERLAEAAAAEARARVEELEARVRRTRQLAGEDLVSRLELETQEAQLAAVRAGAAQAAARVEEARALTDERRAAVERAVVRAPVAGRVGQRNAEVGMLAGPADVLFLLGDLSQLIVEVPFTEEMLAYLREGQPVRIAAPVLGGETIAASLSRVSPFLEPGSFSTTAEIDLANSDGRLRPGMFVTVDVLYGQSEQATLIPTSALWGDPRTGERGVFVVDGAGLPEVVPAGAPVPAEARGVEHRAVQVLAEGRAAIGVDGVAVGEWVVVVGQHLLARDQRVEARVRPVAWERVLELQGLQREDLLRRFLDEQQQWARARGAEPPSNEEFLRGGTPAGGG